MLEILGIASIGVLWINAEPMIKLRMLFQSDNWFTRLINCCLCSTFWIAITYKLVCYQELDLLFAAICSVLGELICKKLGEGKIW